MRAPPPPFAVFAPHVREAALALGFLTRLPLGRRLDPLPSLAASVWAFPLAGLAAAAPAALILWLVPGVLGALLAVAAMIWLTGALHEDGLADFADGMGGRDAARRLEIMRDSRIGSYGALTLVLVTALRVAALALNPAAAGALLAGAAASRAGMGVLMRMAPARAGGLGAGAGRPGWSALGVGCAAAGIFAVLALGWWQAAVALAALAVAQTVIAVQARARLGGQTGDVLGAAQQAGEVAALVALALLV